MLKGPLERAVFNALKDVQLKPRDKAAAQLALVYARRIDDDAPLVKLGPLMLAVLESLGMTPRARVALLKGNDDGPKPANPLDELRQRRERRNVG